MPKSKIFKKKKGDAPAELPDLAVDELKKDLKEAISGKTEEAPAAETQETNIVDEVVEEVPATEEAAPAETPVQETAPSETQTQEVPANEEVVEEVVEEVPATEEAAPAETPVQETAPVTEEVVEEVVEEVPATEEDSNLDPSKSYFNNLLKELNPEGIDMEKLNQWYKEKFPKGDALGDMKEYWEDKKDQLILESIGKDYKQKISENMAELQRLEGQWQKIYFDLITKEEEMKNQEKKLRSIIREFTEIVKKRKSSKQEDKEEKKTKKKSK